MRIELGEPLSCGALIMRAAPAPFLLDREDVAILPDELMARHHATGEEVLRDPVLAISPVERIGAGTRSAVPMIVYTTPAIPSLGGRGKNMLVRDWWAQ